MPTTFTEKEDKNSIYAMQKKRRKIRPIRSSSLDKVRNE